MSRTSKAASNNLDTNLWKMFMRLIENKEDTYCLLRTWINELHEEAMEKQNGFYCILNVDLWLKSCEILYLIVSKFYEKAKKTHIHDWYSLFFHAINFHCFLKIIESASMRHTVTLADMFFHYNEHGHCSISWVNIHCPAAVNAHPRTKSAAESSQQIQYLLSSICYKKKHHNCFRKLCSLNSM